MDWKVGIKLSPSFKTLATPITEEVSSHYELSKSWSEELPEYSKILRKEQQMSDIFPTY